MKTLHSTRLRARKVSKDSGFSLAELMVVIVIIGLLATAVAPKLLDRLSDAKWGTVKADLYTINEAITLSIIANGGTYPDTLEALVNPDQSGKTFLDRTTVPKDPWGNEYGYEMPVGDQSHRVICFGRDGQPGGEGQDGDYDTGMLKNNEPTP